VLTILIWRRRPDLRWLGVLLLGMVLGGALANAVDRVVQGYVVDFIDLQRWPVFNVADMAIVLGILVGVLTLRVVPAPGSREGDPST